MGALSSSTADAIAFVEDSSVSSPFVWGQFGRKTIEKKGTVKKTIKKGLAAGETQTADNKGYERRGERTQLLPSGLLYQKLKLFHCVRKQLSLSIIGHERGRSNGKKQRKETAEAK